MSKAKQQTYTQVRQGKIYNCQLCNQWCDDKINISVTSSEMYMGRHTNKTKEIKHYYCGHRCVEKNHKKILLTKTIPCHYDRIVEGIEIYTGLYQAWLQATKDGDFKPPFNPLSMLLAYKSIKKFFDMILGDNCSLMELTEQKYKTLKHLGDGMEECHKENGVVNQCCNFITNIKSINLECL